MKAAHENQPTAKDAERRLTIRLPEDVYQMLYFAKLVTRKPIYTLLEEAAREVGQRYLDAARGDRP